MRDNRAYINDRIKIEDRGFLSPCWIWQKSLNLGYGQAVADGKPIGAHRLAFATFVGPIPDGLCIDHLCNTRACCNPDHLEPVTSSENVRRSNAVREYKRGYRPPNARERQVAERRRPRNEILDSLGVALLQAKNARHLTFEEMSATMGRSREMISQYIAGEAEMGIVTWQRAVAAWPELADKLNGVRA